MRFLHAFPGDGSVLAVPDLEEESYVGKPGFHDAKAERAKAFLFSLAKALQFELGDIARAGERAELVEHLAVEESGIVVVVVHAFVGVGQARLVYGAQRFRQSYHPYSRTLPFHYVGKSE